MWARRRGPARLAVAGLAALLLLELAAAADVGILRSGSFYESNEAGGLYAILAPRAAALAGPELGAPALRQTPEECSQLCRNTERCAWFQYCSEEVRP